MAKRNIYIDNIPLEQAQKLFQEAIKECSIFQLTESIGVEDALNRVTAEPVFAEISNPHFNAAAMDGIAIAAKKAFGASEKNPARLKRQVDFIHVDTGDVIPEGYDAVIMIEDVIQEDDETVLIYKSPVPWQHIRPIGEDITATEMIIPSNHQISPVDIAALLAGGVMEVTVYKRPKVAILPTGTELVEAGKPLKKGDIIDFNSHMFANLITEWGGEPNRYGITRDDYEELKENILKAVSENDVVLVNAGSSAGSEDYTSSIIRELGEVVVHGIAIKPGKPSILGIIDKKPVLGIPGYPVSAFFVMELFVKPLIDRLTRRQVKARKKIPATTARKIVSSLKHEEYVRVKLGNVDGKFIATPLERGAGVIMSLVKADGFVTIPRNLEGYEAGDTVEVTLFKDFENVKNTIVAIGSHDPMLDILADILHRNYPNLFLSSSHVGSMGGIMALRRGECHIAGIHLLDPEDGTYNVTYLNRYLRNEEMALIHVVERTQGLMVKKGNPKGITSLNDLMREDVRFINRQKGSGTRMLLDYYLNKINIDPALINGYDREEYTHLTTASAVLEDSADVSLGILSAANALGLDFIPICGEQYDLAVPVKFLEQGLIDPLLEVIKSEEFAQALERMGGYELKRIGEVKYLK